MSQFSSTTEPAPEQGKRKRHFTLAEARRALPLVKRVAADRQETQALRLRLHEELSVNMPQLDPKEQERLQGEFDRATDRLERLIDELEKIGVELKDPTRVLLDFPAMHEGREVLLCWKADESAITHWHELDDGFSGRRPLADLPV